MRSALGGGLAIAIGIAACGTDGGATDAGSDVLYGHKIPDASAYEAEAAPKVPFDRMQAHSHVILGTPHIRAIYIGAEGVDSSNSFDAYLSWLLTSKDYWGAILAQYGVDFGTFDGASRVDTSAFFLPGMVNAKGFVYWYTLDKRVDEVIHGIPDDAGASDASDGGTQTLPPIPIADAYVIFLPDGVNVDLGNGTTCANAGGYHSFDGDEPYAIIPPCGRYHIVISHELAEMVTDPRPGLGWYSDADLNNGGGEIGDLCNSLTSIDATQVTQLWSNKDGDCEPP